MKDGNGIAILVYNSAHGWAWRPMVLSGFPTQEEATKSAEDCGFRVLDESPVHPNVPPAPVMSVGFEMKPLATYPPGTTIISADGVKMKAEASSTFTRTEPHKPYEAGDSIPCPSCDVEMSVTHFGGYAASTEYLCTGCGYKETR